MSRCLARFGSSGPHLTLCFLLDLWVSIFFNSTTNNCSGQPIPDSGLSFSSATAGGNPSLN
ncbi:hypothetical protein IPC1350_29970 [Pseudomonas aeruginosa]|nr:hypothetical protein PA34_012445 [Pseudomonas aeruginosa]RPL52062.1 hypothetical protein IPC1350_29970 [Pseudomonas aeruginosa]